jgi:hypothetical protein
MTIIPYISVKCVWQLDHCAESNKAANSHQDTCSTMQHAAANQPCRTPITGHCLGPASTCGLHAVHRAMLLAQHGSHAGLPAKPKMAQCQGCLGEMNAASLLKNVCKFIPWYTWYTYVAAPSLAKQVPQANTVQGAPPRAQHLILETPSSNPTPGHTWCLQGTYLLPELSSKSSSIGHCPSHTPQQQCHAPNKNCLRTNSGALLAFGP